MGDRESDLSIELRERLPLSTEQYDAIFEDTVTNKTRTHVVICEREVGKFFQAAREMGLETDTFRTGIDGQALRGYVKR